MSSNASKRLTIDTIRNSLFNAHEVAEMLRIDRGTLSRWIRIGRFPQGHRLAGKTIFWLEHEITDWIKSR